MNEPLIEYVRKTHTKRFRVNRDELVRTHTEKLGVFVAVRDGNKVKVGWSKCMKGDKFAAESSRDIALQRANGTYPGTYAVPMSFSMALEDFLDRCKRYFHNEKGQKPFPSIEVTEKAA